MRGPVPPTWIGQASCTHLAVVRRSRLRDAMSACEQTAAMELLAMRSSSRARAASAGSGIAAKVSQTWVSAHSVGHGGAALPLVAARPPQQSGSVGQNVGPHGTRPAPRR